MRNSSSRNRTRKLVGIALFSAIVVVLQLLGAFIHLGQFSVTLVLIPIVVGSAVYGVGAGSWLGFMFGFAVLISGDAASFMALNPAGTVLTVLLKGILAGLVVDLVYNFLKEKNKFVAVFVSAVLCPIVNTAVFLVGCYLFFMNGENGIISSATANGYGGDIFKFLILFYVGGNFIFELLVNIVMGPAIVKAVDIGVARAKKRS